MLFVVFLLICPPLIVTLVALLVNYSCVWYLCFFCSWSGLVFFTLDGLFCVPLVFFLVMGETKLFEALHQLNQMFRQKDSTDVAC